jgi:hypothetical protein
MRRFATIVISGALATIACSGEQGPPGPAGPQGQPGPPGAVGEAGVPAIAKGTISGTVKDANMTGLAGVTLTTIPASVTAESDASGAFSLADVPIGSYSVVATKTGYASYTLVGVGVAAKATTTVSLTMTLDSSAPAKVSGTVTDSKDTPTPIVGATVKIEGQDVTATTDAAGAFTLTGVKPGPVFISATPPDLSKFLPTETRTALMANPAAPTSDVHIVLSARPSDAAKYVGMNDECEVCHGATNKITGDQISAMKGSAHNRSLARIARDFTTRLARPNAWTRLLNPPLTNPRTVMIPLAGTVAVPGGTVVTGAGTAFSTGDPANALRAGDKLGYTPKGLGWTQIGVIQSVDSDTQLTLTANATFAPGATSLPAGTKYGVQRLSSSGHTHMWPEDGNDIVAPAWPGVKATNPNYDPNDPCIYGAISSGTCAAGGTSPYPDGQVNVYLCNLKGTTVQGVTYVNDEYVQKFGGEPYTCSDGSFWDGANKPAVPMVHIDVIYGGQGDKDGDMAAHPNMGVFKQRYQGRLADVKATSLWTPPYASTSDRDRDSLTLPIQVLESGDRVNGGFKMNGYHPTEQKFPGESWTQRTRTFSHACAGCHATGMTIGWEMTTTDLVIPIDESIKNMTNAAITSYNYFDENITCEHCHGPGSEHVVNGGGRAKNIINPKYLTAEAERQMCGKCHGYDAGTNAKPAQTYGFEYPWNSDWSDKIGHGNFVAGVFELGDGFDNWEERKSDDETFWDPTMTGGKLYGQAHRQQYTMLNYSAHANNSYVKTTCTSCHDAHSTFKGSTNVKASASQGYSFLGADFKDNAVCLGCHAGGSPGSYATGGPFATLTKDDIAALHMASGGQVIKNETVLSAPTQEQIGAAKQKIAIAVGKHMQDKVLMGMATYDPTNDALPTGRCTTCHMPKVAKSGGYLVGVDFLGNEAIVEGDQASHVFDVIWPSQSNALSRGGPTFQSGYYGQTMSATNVKYDKFGYMPNSCSKCHVGSRKASVLCPDTSTVWPSYWPFNDGAADPNMSWVSANCVASKVAP